MEQKYDVFISYSRKDYVDENKNVIPNNVVSQIKDALATAGISYWFDEEGISYGQDFVEKIVNNIEASKVFLFLSTSNANKSPWTCKEIAAADEFHKHIIPVRIDKSPYNKKVLFRIADINYIDFYTNPKEGLCDVVNAIKAYLEQLQIEEKQREEERIRLLQKQQENQQKLIAGIENTCKRLDNEDKKIELERSNLLLDVEKVQDVNKRNELQALIVRGLSSASDSQQQIQQLMDLNDSLTLELSASEQKISLLECDLADAQKEAKRQKELMRTSKGGSKKTQHIIYLIIIGVFFLTGLWLLIILGNEVEQHEKWENKYIIEHRKYENLHHLYNDTCTAYAKLAKSKNKAKVTNAKITTNTANTINTTTQSDLLSVSKTSITAPASGTTETITVTSDMDWEVQYPTASMYSVTRSGNTLTVKINRNDSTTSRRDYFNVKTTNGSKVQKISLSQKGRSSDLSSNASAIINKVWFDNNIKEGGKLGMRIHINMDVYNLKSKSCEAVVYFYAASGSPLKDQNKSYRTQGGNVCCSEEFNPGHDNTYYEDLVLFMPYDELHIDYKGNFKFFISLWDESVTPYKEIKQSDWVDFTYTP